jgi:hypothetical protein
MRSSLSQAVDTQSRESIKKHILAQLEPLQDPALSPDRLLGRASMYLLLAQAVKHDVTEREAALQKAYADLTNAYADTPRLDSKLTQGSRYREIRILADQFEEFTQTHTSTLASAVSQLAEQCIEKIRVLESEQGIRTPRFASTADQTDG